MMRAWTVDIFKLGSVAVEFSVALREDEIHNRCFCVGLVLVLISVLAETPAPECELGSGWRKAGKPSMEGERFVIGIELITTLGTACSLCSIRNAILRDARSCILICVSCLMINNTVQSVHPRSLVSFEKVKTSLTHTLLQTSWA